MSKIAGIQEWSKGCIYPIVEVDYVNYDDNSVRFESWAPFDCSCRLGSNNRRQQRKDSELLLKLEQLADRAYEALKESNGFTVCYDGTDYDANSGYMVSIEGNECIVSPDRPYGSIYKYLFDHRGQLHCGFCIGGWVHVHGGKLYLDVSLWFSDYDEAVKHGECNNQIGIWDCAAKSTIYL